MTEHLTDLIGSRLAAMYLDLLKKSILGMLSHRHFSLFIGRGVIGQESLNILAKIGMKVVKEISQQDFLDGVGWPIEGLSMIGLPRMNNLHQCIDEVLKNDVPGDFIETGVWRGGACIFMRGALEVYGVKDRKVWVADSFEGLPAPNKEKYPDDALSDYHTMEELKIPLEEVRKNFENYGLLDGQVEFLKGWFKDTLPSAPIEKLSILRLDGDMYESTMDAITALYPKLSVGGFCIVDDYYIPACRNAVTTYREKHGIEDEILIIDQTGAYWKKTRDI